MDAKLERRDSDSRLVLSIERHLEHAPAKVWRALTERELLKQWFPADVKGEWKVGAPLRFEFLHDEVGDVSESDLRGEVLEVVPERTLAFRWGDGVIRCQLIPHDDGGCTLRLSETLNDASWGARNAAGWEMCLENLELALQGATIAKFAWDAWRPRFERYAEKFESEFGPQEAPPESKRPDENENDDEAQ